MNTAALGSRIFEFETKEQSSSYDKWFCAKAQGAIDDPRQGIAHDQVMAEMDAIIDQIEAGKPPDAADYLENKRPY